MTFRDPAAMLPLLVRYSRDGGRSTEVLLAPWLPLERPLEGRLWCDVTSPANALFGNYVDFPAGCGSSEAIEAILRLWQGRPDPVASWLDAEHAVGDLALAPPSSMTHDRNGDPVPHATLVEIPGSTGRMFRVTGEPGATLLLNDEASFDGIRTIIARDGHIAGLRREPYGDLEWTVIPDLGPIGTYWTFAGHNGFAAMSAVALHLAEVHAQGDAPDDVLVVLAHAARRLRYLGPAFRERVIGILARSASDDLDVVALSWCLSLDGIGRERLPPRTARMCELLKGGYPTYTATLDCVGDRMGLAIERPGKFAGALGEASKAVRHLRNLALEGHATLVLGYDL